MENLDHVVRKEINIEMGSRENLDNFVTILILIFCGFYDTKIKY